MSALPVIYTRTVGDGVSSDTQRAFVALASQGHSTSTSLDSVDVEHHHLVSRFEACHACTLVERDDLCPESTVCSACAQSFALAAMPVVCDPQTYLALDGRHASDGDYLDGGAERPVTSAGSSAIGRQVELWRASCPRRHCVRHARVTLFRCKSTRSTLYARGMGDLPPRRTHTVTATLASSCRDRPLRVDEIARLHPVAMDMWRYVPACAPPLSADSPGGWLPCCLSPQAPVSLSARRRTACSRTRSRNTTT